MAVKVQFAQLCFFFRRYLKHKMNPYEKHFIALNQYFDFTYFCVDHTGINLLKEMVVLTMCASYT